MKKIISFLLICAMLFSIPMAVLADEPAATSELTFRKMSFLNGDQFRIYDPAGFVGATGSTLFNCDGTWLSLNDAYKNPTTGNAPGYAVLQYRTAMQGDSEVSYHIQPSAKTAEETDRIYTYIRWQDYTGNGRSFMTSQRGVGFSVSLTIAKDSLTFRGYKYEPNQGAGTMLKASADGASAVSEVIKDAENQEIVLTVSFKANKLYASAALASDPTKTTGEVIWDVSAETAILEAIKDPAGFAVMFAPGEAAGTATAKVGSFKVKDLSVENAAAADIALVNMAFLNGNQFWQYDPANFIGATGETILTCDSEWFALNPDYKNGFTQAASAYGVMQYRKAFGGNYDLSYHVIPSAGGTNRLYTAVHWQDYTNNGRSYQTSQRGVGFAVQTLIAGDSLTLNVLKWAAKDGAGSTAAVAEGSANKVSAEFFKDATNKEFITNISWEDNKLIVSATLVADPTKTTGNVIYDLSGETAILEAIKNPAGFAIIPNLEGGATESVKVGHISVVDKSIPADDFDLSVINPSNFATLASGDLFAMGANGWFTRSTAPAADVGTITYNKPVSYNYELDFNFKLDANNKGRIGVFNIWDGNFGGSHYGYMLVIFTDTDASTGNLVVYYRLCRYAPGYSIANTLATEATKGNLTASTILNGQPANTELSAKIVVQDQSLSVTAGLAGDPTKTMGTVVFDLSGDDQKVVHKNVDRTKGFAIIDMGPSASGGAVASASFGNIVYKSLPGEAPATEQDSTDYAGILAKTDYAYTGDVAVTADNFDIYTYNAMNYEKFAITDGWLTRTNANNETIAPETAGTAYAIAQYKGVMDGNDYRLSFHVKANEENTFRFSVLTRWEDKDDTSSVNFKSQTGFRIYYRVEEGVLNVVCYQTTGGYLAATPATKANATKLSLAGITAKNVELEITLAMKEDLIVTEAHLVSDPSKTTGPVAFDLKDNASLLGQIDRTQGFALVDSANEAKIAPASFGSFKIWANTQPTVGSGGDVIDPDDPDNQTSEESNDTTVPSTPTTEPAPESSTPATTDPAATEPTSGEATTAATSEKGGCKSALALGAAVMLLTLAGGAVVICRKKEQ